ncbi:MAG: BlaI/MecI/CopY family transcriptional regulator [Duncaniella sp.]|nr:BlaI/MecI/CopY family transcriptional regulator [Muribaculum sp.]MCM1256027.1 BlaI/MecI/CopY family transcriptional regulator [Duncaniella sp.]
MSFIFYNTYINNDKAMKAGRQRQLITQKELPIMQLLWEKGPLHVRELLALYPDPKPHFNTIATLVRILEEKGHVGHEVIGSSHRFFATTPKEDFQKKSLAELVGNFFNNSYKNAVSALAEQEKISADELREIIDYIESKNRQ